MQSLWTYWRRLQADTWCVGSLSGHWAHAGVFRVSLQTPQLLHSLVLTWAGALASQQTSYQLTLEFLGVNSGPVSCRSWVTHWAWSPQGS